MIQNSNKIFVQYFNLGETAYREKVRFFEENIHIFDFLQFEIKVEIEIDYIFCLFELGKYERYLNKVDVLIETVIKENIFTIDQINVYNELLFKKAACLYQLSRFIESEFILKQLIKMEKENTLYLGLYVVCKRKILKENFINIKALAVLSFLAVIIITTCQILTFPLLENYTNNLMFIKTALIIIGVVIILSLEIGFQYLLYRESGMFSYMLMNKIFYKKMNN
jgi:tetratricopeptide (TPR) repeat protein